ncbi:sulfatase-like hydrolase/transferase [Lacinutrix sp. WUR7]|uniref:LTA synthase family protein n=1 Tax=Lacinutrix sp. WUR7 TaxID=2653681 RepID=UPI00193D3B62|nr:alkaline phosphatase family protein [Lacinutrix sp. WUR7]QRM87832.1 sulfatase-like hydrolase/transferase [Lacinutrix sp. WUR7]
MFKNLFPNRFSVLKTYLLIFLTFSFVIRISFFIWNYSEVETSILSILKTFFIGFVFDIGTVSFFTLPYAIYLLFIPTKWYGSVLDKGITYFAFVLGLLIFIFSFFSEIAFWEEFSRRFNFIAVDYLIYTSEVLKNINESYPIPILLLGIFSILFLLFYFTKKRDVFIKTFNNSDSFQHKIAPTSILLIIPLLFGFFVTNKNAEQFENRYNNEIAKTGIYSFFAAFRNNELSYTEFYNTINTKKAFDIVKNSYSKSGNHFIENQNAIFRNVSNTDTINKPIKPNVIFICIESLGAKRLEYFGSTRNITPNLDTLIDNSIFFTNLFATGTRTVRGMEAITLSIPPTPGRSIVKRKNNTNLFTIAEVFKDKGYTNSFFYGGDGYFDNMNTYFGGNGFNIVDRGRGFLLNDTIKTTRTNIENNEVTFENAWGVCDEDIFNKVLNEADKSYADNKAFFNFVMTTSNHRPYTYPDNKVAIPSGQERDGAIQYTDFSIHTFLENAKTKPWFKNTVFVIMSDHCAASAGKWELDVANYHIPGFIFNAPNQNPQKVNQLCSQIDMFPTLFDLLNWEYDSNLFGKNVLQMKPKDERAFIGNYRKLGLLKGDSLMVLGDQKTKTQYRWNKETNALIPKPINNTFLEETTAFYQVADYLYSNNGLKIK